MTNTNQTNEDSRPGLIIQEFIKLANWYESSARMIITYPLLINASAAIALVSFFTHNNPPLYAKIAIFSFIGGILFGIFTLVLEFITPYIALQHYRDHFFKNYKNDAETVKQRYDAYVYKGFERILATIKIRIFNGVLAILCCLIGIFFVANNLASNQLGRISEISILFFIYCMIMLYLIKKELKPSKESE